VPIEQHKEEQQRDHEAKLKAYAFSGEGAEHRKEHGQFYADKHDGNGQTHMYPNLYEEKHAHDHESKKSTKQLAKEKAERQEQWIKDKALQNKRDTEAEYERTRQAKKNKAAYLAAKKKEENPIMHSAQTPVSRTPTSSLTSTAVKTNNLPTHVEPKQMDNEIGPNGEVYCNELGLGICLKRVLGVCVDNGPCVHMPTTEPTLAPTAVPTHPTAHPTYEPTTIFNCDPWQAPCKVRGFLNICVEYEPCHSMTPTGSPSIGPTPMPSTTEDCDPLAPPCKHDFLNICYEYWPCADEGNHNSYPTDIVDIFEHNHYNHTHPNGEDSPEDHKKEDDEEDNESQAPKRTEGNGDKDTNGAEEERTTEGSDEEKVAPENPKNVNTEGGAKDPCEDEKQGDNTVNLD
jgi:hypothetical protein